MDRKDATGYFFIPSEPTGRFEDELYYSDPARFKNYNEAVDNEERKIYF